MAGLYGVGFLVEDAFYKIAECAMQPLIIYPIVIGAINT
jgi:hypothetical protein